MALGWDDRIVAVEIDPTDGIFRRYCFYGHNLPATLTPIASMAIVADIFSKCGNRSRDRIANP
jgi:hypothetical protein